MNHSCPECGSYDVYRSLEPDEDGYAEFICGDYGHYFVEKVETDEA